MVSFAQHRALAVHVEEAAATVTTRWNDHMTLTNARLFNGPEKPFLNESVNVVQGLQYLQAEVTELNRRLQAIARWNVLVNSHMNAPSYILQSLLRALAVSAFLIERSRMSEMADSLIMQTIENLQSFVDVNRKILNEQGLTHVFKMYEEAERRVVYEGAKGGIESIVAEVQNEWIGHEEIQPRMVVQVVLIQWRSMLDWARQLAGLGMKFPRQRLITEFFSAE